MTWLDNAHLLPWIKTVRGGIRYDYAIDDKGEIMSNHPSPQDTLRARAAALRAQAEQFERQAQQEDEARARRSLRRFRPISPMSSELAQNVTVMFTRRLSGRDYHYAAQGWRDRKAGRPLFSVTGEESGRFTWAELLAFIGEDNWRSIRISTSAAEPRVRDTSTAAQGPCDRFTWSQADEIVRAERELDAARSTARAGLGDFDGCGNGPW
ncbi:hypothetical protein SEA_LITTLEMUNCHKIN_76 [Gordonia phage LittleMunchkin]|nr:hypothetical protein SEA_LITTLEMUNCHKIN_76 [Gordonia phage LittleMunchkin]